MKKTIPQTFSVLIILVIFSVGFTNKHNYFHQETDKIKSEKSMEQSKDPLQHNAAHFNVTQNDQNGTTKHNHRRR
ncbi:hypothetical protein POV27_17605 [Aureisphaera galaxeae]|uniref:hypothetical protein n=1 Tax=Aureisphaera galaxeae TaxID=1538023 RepID=UPI00234FDA45|nr:hypothetical protein [Aureisphaera galaxeae]MDC8005874.1 hypothetical protein [Aureisphaera galaxeae]